MKPMTLRKSQNRCVACSGYFLYEDLIFPKQGKPICRECYFEFRDPEDDDSG